MVYGDHQPPITNHGDPFGNPFTARSTASDAITTAAFKEIPGLENPRGTVSWGIAAWAKYVLVGNYDHKGSGIFQSIEDQRIGLYDSERKQFCQLDLDPAQAANAGVEWLSVASPNSRRTRIFYEGIATGGGFPFGFVAGDLDNPKPCDAATGWIAHSRGFRASELNAAARAAGQPEVCPSTASFPEACPGGPPPPPPGEPLCSFDGMAVLHHDAASNTDTVEIANWGGNRIVIAQIDGADQLHIVKVDVLPLWQPDDGDPATPDACYTLFPVGRPAVDATRPASDVRFLQAFDKLCAPGDAPGCPSKAICPLSGAACSGSCADSYCTTTFFGSYLRAPTPAPGETCNGCAVSCSNYRIDTLVGPICLNLGTATNACLAAHPNETCTPADDHSSSACRCTAPPTPVQEFRLDASSGALAPTSFLFQATPGETMIALAGGYTRQGDVFLSTSERVSQNAWRSRIIRYPARADGEHDYADPAVTLGSRAGRIVAATGRDYPLKTPGGFGFLSTPVAGMEVGNAMYIVGKDAIERDLFGFGLWAHDTQYKLSFGVGSPAEALPQEALSCAPRTVTACSDSAPCASGFACDRGWCQPSPASACESDAACPSGQFCPAQRCTASHRPCAGDSDCTAGERCASGGGLGESSPANVELGGAPASLWSSPHYGTAPGERAHVDAYLTRVPVGVDLPGVHTSGVPPALAWSVNPHCATGRCDRVWLFGAPEGSPAGALFYRTRDQGLWAPSWLPLPTGVALSGGPAAVYTASSTEFADATVEVYARRQSDGKLVRSQLAAPVDCGTTGRPACAWSAWQAVPASPGSDTEPAVAIASLDGTAVVFLAVKDAAGQLWLAERRAGAWSAWRAIAGITSDASPSLVFKADDSQVWLFARDRQNGAIRYARVDDGQTGPWATAGGAGAVLPWSTAPTAVFTGRLRLLVGSGTFPSFAYQTTFADGAWDDWKPVTSGGGTTRRPAAANVNGDLDLVTTYVTSLQEQLVK